MFNQNPKLIMTFCIIIPARYASTRFPGKPLASIFGKTMIQHVYEKAKLFTENVFVATDDIRITDNVESFGGKSVMTSASHQSGTDRLAEAKSIIEKEHGISSDVIINIQGDEPFIELNQIKLLAECFAQPETQIATLAKKITTIEELHNSNCVKVVFDENHNAIYFSRASIPYVRNSVADKWLETTDFYKHIGIYAYKAHILNKITSLPVSVLEKAESLEQLRWIENSYKIKVAITATETIAVDTPDDLEKLLKIYKA